MSKFQSAQTIPVDFKCSFYNSRRSYRLIRLSNDLLTLLVSDPRCKNLAAAISVNSGAFNDPDSILGLAHLCEHSIFLGNQFDPIPQHFFQLIHAHNGKTNAFTTGETTCFHFEVPNCLTIINEESLWSFTLRNFSSLFLNPTFNESHVQNEISAIDDEHLSNVSNSDKILYHGLKLLANKDHPFSRFCTGNASTISSPNLSKILSSYFHKYFIASKMTLVLVSSQSLNQLQKLAIQHFDQISKQSSSKPLFSKKVNSGKRSSSTRNSSSLFLSDESSTILKNSHSYPPVFIKFNQLLHIHSSNETIYRIVFSYSAKIPNIDIFEKIWCSLIGDESEGSLVQYMIVKLQLANSILAHVINITSETRVLAIDVVPTNKGIRNGWKIINFLMNYVLSNVCKVSEELSNNFKEEISIIKHNCYHQKPEASYMQEAADLAQILQPKGYDFAAEYFLQGFRGLDSEVVDDELICEFVNVSNEVFSKYNVIYMGSNLPNIEKLATINDVKLQFNNDYKFHFTVYDLKSIILDVISPTIPLPNVFLSHTQSVTEQLSSSYDKTFQTTKISEMNPVLINYSKYHEIWLKQEKDLEFNDTVFTTFAVSCLSLKSTPIVDTAILMLCHILGNRLRSKLYPAERFGYQWGIYANPNGILSICIYLSGLNCSYTFVLEYIITELAQFFNSCPISYRDFMNSRIYLRKELENLNLANGLTQAFKGSLVLLEEYFWDMDERINALESICLQDLRVVAKYFAAKLKYTRILVTGDCNRNQCYEICKIIDKFSHHDSNFDSNLGIEEPSSHSLPVGKNYIYENENSNESDPTNTLFYYLQIGPRDCEKSRTMATLVANLFSISASRELRGKKKLGYAVMSGIKVSRSMLGVYISLMSGTYTTPEMYDEVQLYIFELESELLQLSESDFKSSIIDSNSTLENKSLTSNYFFHMPPCASSTNFEDNLSPFIDHNTKWESIFNKQYLFNASDDTVGKVSKQEFMEFFQTYISVKSSTRSSLSIFIKSSLSSSSRKSLVEDKLKKELEKLKLNIPKAILQEILVSSNYEYSLISRNVKLYYMNRSRLKYFYKSIEYLKALSLDPGKGNLAAKKLAKWDYNNLSQPTILDSVEQLREECVREKQSNDLLYSQFFNL